MSNRMQAVSTFERRHNVKLNPLMAKLYNAIYESGRTIVDISDEAGLTPKVISDWFAKGYMARLDSYQAVANVVGVELDLIKAA